MNTSIYVILLSLIETENNMACGDCGSCYPPPGYCPPPHHPYNGCGPPPYPGCGVGPCGPLPPPGYYTPGKVVHGLKFL